MQSLRKIKLDTKQNIFVFLQFFNVFGFFFLIKNNKKKKRKNKKKKKEKPKTETKHVHKQLKELTQGQVNNTHLSKSFLTHIA